MCVYDAALFAKLYQRRTHSVTIFVFSSFSLLCYWAFGLLTFPEVIFWKFTHISFGVLSCMLSTPVSFQDSFNETYKNSDVWGSHSSVYIDPVPLECYAMSIGKYRVFFLSHHQARQLYLVESLHLSGHPLTAAVLRTAIKETHCGFQCSSFALVFP